jgi:uncharacterized membrane protein
MAPAPATLPAGIHVAAAAICLAAVVWALARAPWRRLADTAVLNVWLGTMVLLLAVWSLGGPVTAAQLHMSGAALAALMLEAPLAIIALAAAIGGSALAGRASAGWALDGLLLALVPTIIVLAVHRLVVARLPCNFFIYVLVTAFAGSLLANATGHVAYNAIFAAFGARLPQDRLAYSLLLAWGESVVTGMLVSAFAVYRPQWVRTFDDTRYLRK